MSNLCYKYFAKNLLLACSTIHKTVPWSLLWKLFYAKSQLNVINNLGLFIGWNLEKIVENLMLHLFFYFRKMTVVLSFLQKGRNVKLLQKEVLVYHMSNHRLHSEKTIPLENLKPNLKIEKKKIDFQPIKNPNLLQNMKYWKKQSYKRYFW